MRHPTLRLFVLACLCGLPRAQDGAGHWNQLANTGPFDVDWPAMAGRNGEALVFGGWDAIDGLDMTMAYRRGGWSFLNPPARPTKRGAASMTYDSRRGVYVLYGGVYPGGVNRLDTWEWNGTTWTQSFTAHNPGRTVRAGMAFDAARGVTLLVGPDTWRYDGTDWSQVATGPGNGPLAFDVARHRCVWYGGNAGTREWDGNAWSAPVTGPVVSEPLLAYDADHGVTVLVDATTGDIHTYDGTRWTTQYVPATRPPSRIEAGVAYAGPALGLLIYAGGPINGGLYRNDLWQYVQHWWTTGSGCTGTASYRPDQETIAAPAAPGGSLSYFVDFQNSGAANLPIVQLVGFSSTQWGGIPLPLDLAAFGLPGCSLYTSIELTQTGVVDPFGYAVWTLPIPNNPALVGGILNCQTMVLQGAGIGLSALGSALINN
ncbi:MAG: hypothetical protein R3F56_19470 [Planctomycetota bacterium]